MLAGIVDPEIKAVARLRGEGAVARGVFGSPWIFVDGEPFWGSDRLPMVDRWLAERAAAAAPAEAEARKMHPSS